MSRQEVWGGWPGPGMEDAAKTVPASHAGCQRDTPEPQDALLAHVPHYIPVGGHSGRFRVHTQLHPIPTNSPHRQLRGLQTGQLGRGSFGVVLRALDTRVEPQGEEVAIKLLPRGEFVSGRVWRRVYLLVWSGGNTGSLPSCKRSETRSPPYPRLFAAQIRNYKTYVKREIIHQSLLRHPSIIRLREVCGRVNLWVGP